jgi:glycosyltransferase involved in cell wall biosynthesis
MLPSGATVTGLTPELETGLPAEWATVPAGEGPVVVVAPASEDQVRHAHQTAGPHPLVVLLPNLADPALVRALLLGAGDEVLPGPSRAALTRATVDRVAGECGRRPATAEAQPHPRATGRPLDDLLAEIAVRAGGCTGPWVVRAYHCDDATPVGHGPRPFLSVLVRTQGRRTASLSDVLLCLAAQTTDDFEVLLLAHDVTDADAAVLESTTAGLPEGLRQRTTVVRVEGGGRSRPLNVGVGRSHGRFLAVLDDDDLVLAGWVEAFHDAARQSPGSIVRSLAVEQDMELRPGRPGFRAKSWPSTRWEAGFSLLSHLVDNHSPVHSYALPREVFQDLGLRFDETLPVLEDWDLLVRAAALLGVHDTGNVTAVYRRWPAASSSFAEHAEEDWPRTAWQVVASWDRAPLLLPAGSATPLREAGIYVLRHRPLRRRLAHRVDTWRDRWSAGLMRTPAGRPVRWLYRLVRGRRGRVA